MKRVLKFFGYFCAIFFCFGVLYIAAEAILSRITVDGHTPDSSAKTYDVYVMSNDVHTDIVFPVVSDQIDWRGVFPTDNVTSKDSTYKYVGIGWGDKGFYLNTPEWKDLSVKTALVAAFGLGGTALHVTYHPTVTENELCYKVTIDSSQYAALVDYVLDSYQHDDAGKPLLISTDALYGDSDAFYEAKGSYSIFHSCNTWANKALKKARMPSAFWTVFDKGILRHYGYHK